MGGGIFCVGRGGWIFFMDRLGEVAVGGSVIWVGGTFFMAGLGWMEVYFGWVGVGGSEWGWPLVLV